MMLFSRIFGGFDDPGGRAMNRLEECEVNVDIVERVLSKSK